MGRLPILGFPLAVDFGGTSPVPLVDTVGLPDMSLTCNGPSCGATDYEALGYSRWHFFEFLSERFGSSSVNDLFQRGKTVNDPAVGAGDLLMQMLTAKGSTLGDVFHDWTVANMTGAYTAIGLKGINAARLLDDAHRQRLWRARDAEDPRQPPRRALRRVQARHRRERRPLLRGNSQHQRDRALRHRRAPDVQVDGNRQPRDSRSR